MKKSLLILLVVLIIMALGWVWLPMQREYNRIQDEALQASLNPADSLPPPVEAEIIEEVAPPALPTLPPELAARATVLVAGEWRLEQLIDSTGEVIEVRRPDAFTLRFTEAGQVAGQTDCNNFSGRYVLTENDGIAMGPFAMTKMACPDSQEQDFIQAVTAATTQTILPSGSLELRNELTGSGVVLEQLAQPELEEIPADQAATSTESSVETVTE